MSKYTSDQPITEPTNDEFNRAVFATDFIKIISNFKDTESYVIGLYGKWGSGKTSTINLILKQLASKNDIYSISINAWALGGDHEIILWDILNQISTKLTDKKAKTKRARFGHLLKKVSKAELPFDLSSEIPLDSSTKNNMNSSSGKILNTVSYLGQILSSSDNISLARNRIESYIKNKKIIVIIDDLDRLPGKQIINILRSINTIADYGGISYVLPIDIQYVSSAVEEQLPFGQSGSEFIEKVIQLPIDLPTLTQEKIDHVLFDKINILLIEHKITLSEDEIQRFQRLYFELNKYIKSPRDINKIINVLRFRMPISNTEINIVDLIILEIIRLFDKRFYEIIKTHRDLLINHIHIPSVKYRLDNHNKKRTIDADKLDINSDQKEILQQLFPAFDALYTNTNFSNKDTLRKLKRIADENYFDLFFASLDSEINVSNKQILEIVQLSDTPDKLNKALFSTINTNNFDFALRLIIDNISLIKDPLILSTNLLDLVDTFQTKYDSPGLQLSPFSTLLLRINDILRGSNTKLTDYITLLDHNYHKKRIETLPLLIREVDVYSEKKDSKYHINLTEDELAEYKKHALEIITSLSVNNEIPVASHDTSNFLYAYWVKYGDKTNSDKYIKRRVQTSTEVLDFISQFLGKATTLGTSISRRTDLNSSTYESIDSYVDVSYLYQILISDSTYNQLMNIKQNTVDYFEDMIDENALSIVGNEQSAEFRLIIAKQFIYLYEQNT